MAFWVLIGSLFIFQGPYFHYFGFIQAKNVNLVCMYTTMVPVQLLANYDFYLCLRINVHTSLFWVLILTALGPYWVLISQKMGPYWVLISKLGGPY